MDVKEILEELNTYYWTKHYIGLRDEPSSPELSKMENCAFLAVLKTFTKGQLQDALDSPRDYAIPLTYMISRSLDNEKPDYSFPKNLNINTLIDRYIDKKSKCVVESRKEILTRYPYQDYSTQKKIVKAFLSSPTLSDVEWAAVEADKRWDKSYIDDIAKAYEKRDSEKLAITVIRHMPIEYVKSKESSLVMHSRSEYCIRNAEEADWLIRKYDLSVFEELYVKARIGKKPDLKETQVERRFFRHIYLFSQKVLLGIYENYNFLDRIPWIRRAIWALGEFGYRDIVMKFLALNKYSTDAHVDCPNKSRFYFAEKWIIKNYFPEAIAIETINWNSIVEKLTAMNHPTGIKVNALYDIEEYDDLPPARNSTSLDDFC